MSFIKNNNKYLAYKEDEPPKKRIMSDADILIKDLANKQQIKNINLQECLKQEKSFEKLSEHITFTNYYSGTLSLENFKKAVEQLECIEDLKSCNLTNDDVKLVLDYRNGKKIYEHSNVEPNILQSRIERVMHSIKECKRKVSRDCSTKNITHKQNEGLAVKPDSLETKLLKFALENKHTSTEKIPHPMDNIKTMEADLFSHIYEKKLTPCKVQKQLRRYANRINANVPTENCEKSKNCSMSISDQCSFVDNSKWDQNIAECTQAMKSTTTKAYTCKPQNYYTIREGEIVKLDTNNLRKNIHIQKEERLTIEEIKSVPRFAKYDIGVPSNILYLKNLPKHIKESDLEEVFSEFTINNNLLIRIMTGRMMGQAFVTFPNVEIASEALSKINGMLLDGKPVLIEYGKKS